MIVNRAIDRLYSDDWLPATLRRSEFAGHDFMQLTTYNCYLELRKLKAIVEFIQAAAARRGRAQESLRLLDLGCGVGNIALPLGSLGMQVLGVDLLDSAIATARDRNRFRNVSFRLLTVAELAALDLGTFDYILASEIIEHLPDPRPELRTWRSRLEPGGYLVASVPNGFGSSDLLMTQPMQLLRRAFGARTPDGHDHVQHFTFRGLRALLRECGFGDPELIRGLGTISGFPFISRSSLARWDCAFSERLPATLRDRWLIGAAARG